MKSGTPLSIMHVSTPSSWRGGEQQLYYLMEELEKQNISQYLFCRSGGALAAKAKGSALNVIEQKQKGGLDLSFARQLAQRCKSLEITHLHTHDSKAHTLALLSCVLFKNKATIIVSRRVDFKAGKSAFSAWKYNHRAVKKIICVSKAIEKVMKPAIKQPKKLCTIHSGIDLTRFEGLKAGDFLRRTYNVSDQVKLIGNTSAIAPHKDYFTFVDTAKILLNQGLHAKFFIIGEGPEREKIEQYIKDHQLEKQIILTGFQEDILPILAELDLFLITSKTEGLGTSILDAFACGVPVVATAAGGIPEIVIDGKTGRCLPVQNSEALAAAVLEHFTDPEPSKQFIDAATQLLLSFSKAQTAEQTLQVYRETLH